MKRLTVLMVLVASICFAQTKVDWRQIKNTPTTVDGYGITDVAGAEELERLKNELERIEGEIPNNASFTYEALTHTDGEILENYLATDSVTTEKILDDAVTTEKILDGAVTDSKIDSLSSRKLTGDITTDDVSIAIHADVEGDYPPTIHRADTVTKTRGLYLSGGDKPVSEGMEGFNLFLGSATDPYMRAFAGTALMMQMFPPSMGLNHPISFKEPVIIEGDLQISNKLGIFNYDAENSEAYNMALTNDKGEAILDMNGYKLKLELDAHSVTAKLGNSANKVILREETPGYIELVTPNNAILTLKGGEVVADPLKAGKLDLYRGQAALSVEDTSTSGYSNVLLDAGNLTSQASNRLNLYAGDSTKLILKDGVASLTGRLNVSDATAIAGQLTLGSNVFHGPMTPYTPALMISGGMGYSSGSRLLLGTDYQNLLELKTHAEDTKLHMEDGIASLTGKLNVSGDTVIDGKLTVDGVNGLRVTGGAGAYIDSVLAVGGNISHGSTTGSTPNLVISGGTAANNGSTLELSTGFKNKIELKTADGDTKITMEDGSVTVTDRLEVTGDLDVKGSLSVEGDLYVQGVNLYAKVMFPGEEVFRYGIKITQNTSDPCDRVTYLYDAVGMTPAYMDYSTGEFNYGDWEPFCRAINRPVMLKYDGTVDYELDWNNQTLKKDGSPSDISDTNYGGNAMAEFKRLWVSLETDANNDISIVFSNVKYNENYFAHAFTNEAGKIQDAMYYAMFEGSYVNPRLRSMAAGGVQTTQSGVTEIARAEANGNGWYINYKSQRDYITFLLWLIGKSTDTQLVFGNGNSDSGSFIAPGSLVSNSQFSGADNTPTAVKTFFIENYWGNYWKRMAGLLLDKNTEGRTANILVAMTPPYALPHTDNTLVDYSKYIDTGGTISGASGGYLHFGFADNSFGFVHRTTDSSYSHYKDGSWHDKGATIKFSRVGGSRGNGSHCGAAAVYLISPLTSSYTGVGAALSFLKTGL